MRKAKSVSEATVVVVCRKKEKFSASEVFATAVIDFFEGERSLIARGNFSKAEMDSSAVVIRKQLRSVKKLARCRPNGVPYSIAGEIWEKYGSSLVDRDIFQEVDQKIIQKIDMHEIIGNQGNEIIQKIELMNDEEASNERFFEAVELAKDVLREYLKKSLARFDQEIANIIYGETKSGDRNNF